MPGFNLTARKVIYMILVIDVGNTNIVLGIYEDKKLLEFWRIGTEIHKTSDEYGMMINQLFSFPTISCPV